MLTSTRRTTERGATMVEFSVVGLIFSGVVLGIIAGAWYVYSSSATAHAAREGARRGIVSTPFCDSVLVTSGARSQAGPLAAAIVVSSTQSVDVLGTYCEVTVAYPYAPFGGSWPFPSATIRSTSREYQN